MRDRQTRRPPDHALVILAPRAVPAARALAALISSAMLACSAAAQNTPPAWAPTLDSIVRADMARGRVPGATVAVVANGRVVYTQGYGVANAESQALMTPTTLLRVGSVTKMITGATAAVMAQQGTLDLQAPIGRVVPELSGKRVGTVTTHQLLTHHAGWLDNADAYGRMGEGALGEVMREVSDTMFFTAPGQTFSYSNPGFSMAGYVAEVAGKRRYAALVQSLVLAPLGMSRSTFKPLEALTYPLSMGHRRGAANTYSVVRPMTENTAQWAAGFLFSTAPELGCFAIAVMDSGRVDGQQVLPPDAVRLLTTGHAQSPASAGRDAARYGYGLNITTRGAERVWSHGGAIDGYASAVSMLPDRRAAVIILTNIDGGALPSVADAAYRLAVGVTFPPPAAPPAPRAPSAAERAALAGTYRMAGRTVQLVELGDSLVAQQGMLNGRVSLVGADHLLVRTGTEAGATVGIRRDANGRGKYLYLGSRALARQ